MGKERSIVRRKKEIEKEEREKEGFLSGSKNIFKS